jgi:hypothetical protein
MEGEEDAKNSINTAEKSIKESSKYVHAQQKSSQEQQQQNQLTDTLNAMEGKPKRKITTSFKKKELLMALSPTVRRYFKLLRLLESGNDCKRSTYKWFTIISIVWLGLHFILNLEADEVKGTVELKPQMAAVSLGIFVGICIPIIIFYIYKYFDDQGENFYQLWRHLSVQKRKKSSKVLRYITRIIKIWACFMWLVFTIIVLLLVFGWFYPTMEAWFRVYEASFYFSIVWNLTWGGLYCFGLTFYLIAIISSAASEKINQISSETIDRLTDYSHMEEGEIDVLKELTRKCKVAELQLQKGYKTVGICLAQVVIIGILQTVIPLLDIVLLIIGGFRPRPIAIIVLIMYTLPFAVGLYVVLSYATQPSIDYTAFIHACHKPDTLWTISKCYSGNQATLQYFFDGLELQRQHFIWKAMGLPITMELYHRVIGSLVSINLASVALALRSTLI